MSSLCLMRFFFVIPVIIFLAVAGLIVFVSIRTFIKGHSTFKTVGEIVDNALKKEAATKTAKEKSEAKESKYCKNCGAKINKDTNSCDYCGK